MPLLLLIILPAVLIFDIIPQGFGFEGLSNWYVRKYRTEADSLLMVVYFPVSIIIYLIII